MQLQRARQKKEEPPPEFLDLCRLLALKTFPKIEDPLFQNFHNDKAERMLMSTFIAGQQFRFQMPVTVDQAIQIAITVFEAEGQEERNLVFFFEF